MKIDKITLIILSAAFIIHSFQINRIQKRNETIIESIQNVHTKANTNDTLIDIYGDFVVKNFKNFDKRIDKLEANK